jgi:hypothetical protein
MLGERKSALFKAVSNMKSDPKIASGRAFVRSLNILLKFARLYGYDHARTVEHLKIAHQELKAAIPSGSEAGLLLGATGAQLLLDGVPLEGSPAEKQFAQLLSAAGLASVQFFDFVTEPELSKFARAFPTGKAKPSELAQQLKLALQDIKSVRINEVCFVATDARLKDASIAAQLAASTLGSDQEQFREWLNDPQKLLEMIAAAEGIKGGSGGSRSLDSQGSGFAEAGGSRTETEAGNGVGTGNGNGAGIEPGLIDSGGRGGVSSGSAPLSKTQETSATAGAAGGAVARGSGSSAAPGGGSSLPGRTGTGGGTGRGFNGRTEPSETEMFKILGALTSLGQLSVGRGGLGRRTDFQQQFSELPGNAKDILKQALASIAAKAPNSKPDQTIIVQLAEHLAIRFALERFERGEVKVNSVRQMLDRMNHEIENLRKILGAHEEKMSEAGMLTESHREILDRQFWAAVPESGKKSVLLSEEAWCIPARNVQSFVNDLIAKGDSAQAIHILQNYAACAESNDVEARKRTASGLSEMAELYAKAGPKLLGEALRHVGVRLSVEQDGEVQAQVSAAFVRLSQQAATARSFEAMEQALNLVSGLDSQRPGIARTLRTKMGIEQRVPEFVDEALKARQAASGLTNILKMLPLQAIEHLAARFNRCNLREDAEHVARLAGEMGEVAVQHLRSLVRGGTIADSVEMVGLLSKLDSEAIILILPARMKDFPPAAQDRVVRQISASGANRRCHLLLEILEYVDPLVMPLVVDEIGVSADRQALGRLLTIADGDLPEGAGEYLRAKAVEAIGRIHAPESIQTLRRVVEAKKIFHWVHPQELRIAAMQALLKMDPEWAQDFLPKSGIERHELALAPIDIPQMTKFVRNRRHVRVRLPKSVRAVSTNLEEGCTLEIKTASLNGGVATINRHLAPGTQVNLKLSMGLRHLQATALMRDYRAQDMAFEIVDMNLEDRGKLRRILSGNLLDGPAPEQVQSDAIAEELPVHK